MKRLNDLFTELLVVLIFASPIIVLLVCIVLWAYCLIEYGGKPITEIPAWAFWMLSGGK